MTTRRLRELANRISVGFMLGLGVLLTITALFELGGLPDARDRCDSHLCFIGLSVFKLEFLLLLALGFGVGIGKSLIDVLRQIRDALDDQPVTYEDTK